MVPRRNILSEQEDIELQFNQLIQEVEKMGADVALTDAVRLLTEAKDRVSDYIDRL